MRGMNYQQIVKLYSGVTGASRALGFSRQTIYNWRKGIPAKTQELIEYKSSGRLKRK